jgi:hypothetical protein
LYDVCKLFHDTHFTNVITEHHLKEVRQFEDLKGWVAIKDKERYLLPELVDGEDIRKILPIRIVNTVDHTQGTAIYRVVKELQRFSIPAKHTMSFREWVDAFCPFQHSSPHHFLLYKLLILGGFLSRFHFRIASNPAFGKDSLPLVFSHVLPLECAVYFPRTNAKLMHMVERQLLVITEIPDAAKTDLKMLEPIIRIAGDMRPVIKNSALALAGMTKEEYDISHLSMGFIYNELDDYRVPKLKEDRTDHYFDFYFTQATKERFLPLRLQGTLDPQQFRAGKAADIFAQEHAALKSWVMSAHWYLQNPPQHSEEQLQWPAPLFTALPTGKGRLWAHIAAIIEIFRLYAQTPEEFYRLCLTLQDCYVDYQKMFIHEDIPAMHIESIE